MDVDARKAQLTREWMPRAQNDLRTAGATLTTAPPILVAVVYHCQQAFEKVLKGFLTWHDRPFRKTHELPDLVGWCADIDPDFAQLLESATMVSPYAWEFRYPVEDDEGVVVFMEPTAEEAEDALRVTHQAVDFVLARLPDTVQP